MAKKNNNNGVENKNKNNDGGEKKKADGPIASKIVKWIKYFKGMLSPTEKLDLISGADLQMQREIQWFKEVKSILENKKNGGNDGNDGNDGGGDEKKKKEDEGNGVGKMKYPAGRSGFGQFSYGKVYRHGYGYQNGALKTGENMLLLCCEVVGLLVMYNHLAKDIYSALHTHHLLYI
ncbi:unnamed protein product [Prunus brigantina]